MIRSCVLLTALLATILPASAQPGAALPDTVLTSLWARTLYSANAAADALDEAFAEETLEAGFPTREAWFRAYIVTASQDAAAAQANTIPAFSLTISLAPPSQQAAVRAALDRPTLNLYFALLTVMTAARNLDGFLGVVTDRSLLREQAQDVRRAADALAVALAALGQ